MMGAAGCRWLPESLVWWDGSGVFGHVLERHGDELRPLRLEEPAGDAEVVEAADGLCLITQHDLEWDEAIPGFHFYDVAQSTRFLLRGYEVVVARQGDPWVRHDIGVRDQRHLPAYAAAQETFKTLYGSRRDRFVRSRVRRRVRRLATRATVSLRR